jgi:hypothetical protein
VHLLKRIVVMLCALLLAVTAAAHVCMITWYAPDWRLILAYGLPHGSLAPVVATIFIFVTSVPFVLFVFVILLAEIYALRSVLFFIACGLALTLLVRYEIEVMIGKDDSYELTAKGGLILLATGVALGFVYWVIAGRNAGKWRGDMLASKQVAAQTS